MSDLKRTAVITGAAQGIGRKTAEVLAERGYRLALMDLRMPEQTLESVGALGAKAFGFAGSVTDESGVERFAREVHLRWGPVEVVVNNAGISFIAPAETVAVKDFRQVLEVNLVGPFVLAKAFGTKMLEERRGSIINVASVAGLVGIADRAAYNASKHG